MELSDAGSAVSRGRRKSRTSLEIFRGNSPYRAGAEERNGKGEEGREGDGEKRCYRRQDEGTRILFKAEHFTAARSAGGNGGSSATPEELIRG